MKTFLVCSGVRGRERALDWLRQIVAERRPDGVLFAGGVFDGPRQYAARAVSYRMTHTDMTFLQGFFKAIGELGVFAAVIPGPGDLPLRDFLRAGMYAEIEYPGLHLVHASLVSHANLAVNGLGSVIQEDAHAQQHTCSRTMAEYSLRGLAAAKQPYKFLLLGAAPPGQLGGRHGSEASNFFIDSLHPSVCVVGGDSERRGVERVANTLVINPGSLADGHAAWLDLRQSGPDQVEMVDFHRVNQMEAMEVGVSD
jgi:hypothetical protein